jgi:hypothetical protein
MPIRAPTYTIHYENGGYPEAGNSPYVNHNFIVGDLTIDGLAGNGSTKYLDTGINLSAAMISAQAAGHAAYFFTSATNSTTQFDYGVSSTGGSLYFVQYAGAAIGESGANTGPFNQATSAPSPGPGFYSDNRVSSIDHKLYYGRSTQVFGQIGATDTLSFSSTFANLSSFIGAINTDATTPINFSPNRISYTSLKVNFSANDVTNEFNAVQAARVILGGGFR